MNTIYFIGLSYVNLNSSNTNFTYQHLTMISMRIITILLAMVILFQPVQSSAGHNWGWSSTQNGYKFIIRVSFDDLVWMEGEQISVN